MTDQASERRGCVLVVDDEPGIIDILTTNLAAEGFEVIGAADGLEGLELARQRAPDLIVLDIMLPKLDGWEVLRHLESRPATAGTPIVVLTARTEDADVLRGLQLGAVEYVTKPFYPADLVATIKIQLEVLDPVLRDRRRADLISARRELMRRQEDS
jgi:DNA-binding response OmpR family regulator